MTQDALKNVLCVNEKRSMCNQSEVLTDLICAKCFFSVTTIFYVYFSRYTTQSGNFMENVKSPIQDVLGRKLVLVLVIQMNTWDLLQMHLFFFQTSSIPSFMESVFK